MTQEIDAFIENNETIYILIAVLPITFFRIGWNIITYNKIHSTNYVPGFQKWQKDGLFVNFYCTIIFWWIIKINDKDNVLLFKKIGNWISIISILIFIVSFSLKF